MHILNCASGPYSRYIFLRHQSRSYGMATIFLLGSSELTALGGAQLTYTASFYYRFPNATSFRGNIIVGLQTSTGLFLGDTAVAISGAQTTWLQVTTTIKPAQAPFDNNNFFTLTVDGTAGAGQTVHFAMLSLFPPTFRNRVNGMRLDIANALVEMAPTFFRIPGGNNLVSRCSAFLICNTF